MIGARDFRRGDEAYPQQVVRALYALLGQRRHVGDDRLPLGPGDAEDLGAPVAEKGIRRKSSSCRARGSVRR